MSIQLGSGVDFRVFGWATPAPGVTLDDLIAEFRALGNEILEVDREHNRLRCLDHTEHLEGPFADFVRALLLASEEEQ